jgi:hypothetical protein
LGIDGGGSAVECRDHLVVRDAREVLKELADSAEIV